MPGADERLEERAMLGGRHRAEHERGGPALALEAFHHPAERVPRVHVRRPIACRPRGWARARGGATMYSSASIEISAACRSSSRSTSGRPPARRIMVRASSSKIWVRLSGRGRAAPVERRAAARGGADLGDLGEDREEWRPGRARGPTCPPAACWRSPSVPEVLEDDLEEALVGQAAVLLEEAAVEHAHLPRFREALELVEQPRLADAGVAADEHQLRFARRPPCSAAAAAPRPPSRGR